MRVSCFFLSVHGADIRTGCGTKDRMQRTGTDAAHGPGCSIQAWMSKARCAADRCGMLAPKEWKSSCLLRLH
ncbi:hypothetical protein BRYFOR_05900 [Marvinbryantia formatexigens DSM 14469]|uniref:Uncharacterized protein n=1 Tax=Marvinbryantia formatexigens DSM 14469 TaxID=478749 RepID=C6LBA5_9FIRM|nr:hypothetical protein BRYFOR_05900 [Marvinbryantia formatexigens DSM 14469]